MTYATILGLGVMLLGASLLLLVALGATWWLTGLLGNDVFKRLRRIYHLSVIGYWLDRLEKGGMREFQKAEEYDKALKAKGVGRAAAETARESGNNSNRARDVAPKEIL